MSTKEDVLIQLNALIETGQQLTASYHLQDYTYESSAPEADLRSFVTSALAAIGRIAGESSLYYRNIPLQITSAVSFAQEESPIPAITGVLMSLRDAIDQGLLESLESKLRANMHDDFLVQASELLDVGYHVAAMVLIGGVLEDHLQKMAQGRGLTLPKKGSISKYNDLLRENPYSQSVWRRIQSIGDLRNEAAHGNGSKIKPEDVKEAHGFAQRFIADHPA